MIKTEKTEKKKIIFWVEIAGFTEGDISNPDTIQVAFENAVRALAEDPGGAPALVTAEQAVIESKRQESARVEDLNT